MKHHEETKNDELILYQLTWRGLCQESFGKESNMQKSISTHVFVYNHINKYVCIYTFMWTFEQVINMEGYILIGKAELSDTGQDEQAWIWGQKQGNNGTM